MQNAPLISVIIPVYNVEKYLCKCLDSICGQTYRNLEILCVNDGSTDGSADILEEYAAGDARIRVFHQPCAGQSAARNLALDNARGEWITGVDSDDYLEPDAYEYALAEIDEQTDIITFGARLVWEDVPEDSQMQQYFDVPFRGRLVPDVDIISRTPVTFWNKLWRKSFIDRFNFRFPVGLWYEDACFYFALAPFARGITYLSEKKYHYVRRSGSVMSQTVADNPKLFDRLRIAQATLDFYQQHPLPEELQKMRLVAFYSIFASSVELLSHDAAKAYFEKAHDIALQYGLLEQYFRQLRFLNTPPWYLKPFVKHKISKSYYGLPGFPLLTISRRNEYEIIRLLGIKIKKRAL